MSGHFSKDVNFCVLSGLTLASGCERGRGAHAGEPGSALTERKFISTGRVRVSEAGSSARAGLTSFGVSVGSRTGGVSRLAAVRSDAPLPLAFSLQHPSDSARRLTRSLGPGGTRRNLAGLNSMAPGASVLGSQGPSGSLVLGRLVHTGYLRSSVIGDLFAMIAQFVISVHLVG